LITKNPKLTVINISSTSGESGRGEFMAYGISKSGMIIMTEALVEEGFSSYCINPGRLKSKLRENIFGHEDQNTLLEPKHVICVVDNIINGLYANGSILTVRVDDGVFKIKEFKRK
jgi:NAD(P)-dependent dehydrogenase (short-subunit alcohol dehydrogenase family)